MGATRPWLFVSPDVSSVARVRTLGICCGDDERRVNAIEISQRQERKSVRGPEDEGDVQGSCGAYRQCLGRVEQWRQKVRLGFQFEAGWHHRAEEGGRPEGRKGHCPEVIDNGLYLGKQTFRASWSKGKDSTCV